MRRAASSRSSLTGIGTAGAEQRDALNAPRMTRGRVEHGERAQLWPTSAARSTPSASSRATSQSAIASTDASGVARRCARGRASRPRARCIRDARSSATAAPRRRGRSPRRARKRSSACAAIERARSRVRVDRRGRATATRIAIRSALLARRAARGSRSSIRSSASSRPTDRRIVPSVMPAAFRSSADIRKCVVDRRMDHQRFRVADIGEMRKDPQRLDEPAALRARAARGRKLNTAPQPSRQQPLRERVVRMRRAVPDSRPPRRTGASRESATILRVFSTCRCMRSGSVSMPCRIWNAVIGAMHAPKSRMPSRRARSRNAAVVDSSANTMSWKPA